MSEQWGHDVRRHADRGLTRLKLGDPNQYISSSMLGTFDFCPLCFRKTLIEGRQRELSPELELGAAYHEAMEDWLNGMLVLEDWPPQVQEWVKWTLALEHRRQSRPGWTAPVSAELYLASPQLNLSAHIDRVDRDDQGWYIIEYKTGRTTRFDGVMLQLGLQAVVFEAVTGGKVVQLVMINPRLKQVKTWEFNERLVKRVAYRVAKIRHAIATDSFEPKCTIGKWRICQLCPIEQLYKRDCPK